MSNPIQVLYASMTGNSRDCAEQITRRLVTEGHTASARDLAQYVASDILGARTLLVCISTWGDGEPPDDGCDFVNYLRSLRPEELQGTQFSVLALGDTGYEQFCQCGKDVDILLEQAGAIRIADRVDCDVDFEDGFNLWCDAVSTALAGHSAQPA